VEIFAFLPPPTSVVGRFEGYELQFVHQQTQALQAAEKLFRDCLERQGTTLVVPQMQPNKGRALAPAFFFRAFCLKASLFPQPV
jgi:hypothetical protein